jgi:hypothetical protein
LSGRTYDIKITISLKGHPSLTSTPVRVTLPVYIPPPPPPAEAPIITNIIPLTSTSSGGEAIVVWKQKYGDDDEFSIWNAATDSVIIEAVSSITNVTFSIPTNNMKTDQNSTINIGGFKRIENNASWLYMMYRIKNNELFVPGNTYNLYVRASNISKSTNRVSNNITVRLPNYFVSSPSLPTISNIFTLPPISARANAVIVWYQDNIDYANYIYSINKSSEITEPLINNLAISNETVFFNGDEPTTPNSDINLVLAGFLSDTRLWMMYRINNSRAYLPGETYSITITATNILNGSIYTSQTPFTFTAEDYSNVYPLIPIIPSYTTPTTGIYGPEVVTFLPSQSSELYASGIFTWQIGVSLNNIRGVFIITNTDTNEVITSFPFVTAQSETNLTTNPDANYSFSSVGGSGIFTVKYRIRNNPAFLPGTTYNLLTSSSQNGTSTYSAVTVVTPNFISPVELYSINNTLPANLISPIEPTLILIWKQPMFYDISSCSFTIRDQLTNTVIANIPAITNIPFDVDQLKTNEFDNSLTTNSAGFVDNSGTLWMMYRFTSSQPLTVNFDMQITAQYIQQVYSSSKPGPTATEFSIVNQLCQASSTSVSATLNYAPLFASTIYSVGGSLPSNLVNATSDGGEAVIIWNQPLNKPGNADNITEYAILNADTNDIIASIAPVTDSPFTVASWGANPYTADTTTNIAGFIDANNMNWMLYRIKATTLLQGLTYNIKIKTVCGKTVFSNIISVTIPSISPQQSLIYNIDNNTPSNFISPTADAVLVLWSQPLFNALYVNTIVSYDILNAATNDIVATVLPTTDSSFNVVNVKSLPYFNTKAIDKAGFVDADGTLWMLYRVKNFQDFTYGTYGSSGSFLIKTNIAPATDSIVSNTVSVNLPLGPPVAPPSAQLYNENDALHSSLISTNSAEAVFIWSQQLPTDGSIIVSYNIVSTSYSTNPRKLAELQVVGEPLVYEPTIYISDNTVIATVPSVTDKPFDVSRWTTNHITDASTNIAGFIDVATNRYWMLYRVRYNSFFKYPIHNIKITSVTSFTASSDSNLVNVTLPVIPQSASLYQAISSNSVPEVVLSWVQPLSPTLGMTDISSYTIINIDTGAAIDTIFPITNSIFDYFDYVVGNNAFTTYASINRAGYIFGDGNYQYTFNLADFGTFNNNNMLLRLKLNPQLVPGSSYNLAVMTTSSSGKSSVSNTVSVTIPQFFSTPSYLYNIDGELPDNLMSPTDSEAIFIWEQPVPNISNSTSYIASYSILSVLSPQNGGVPDIRSAYVIDTVSVVTNLPFNVSTYKTQVYDPNSTEITLGNPIVQDFKHTMMRRIKNNPQFWGGKGGGPMNNGLYYICIRTNFSNGYPPLFSNIVKVALPISVDVTPILYGISGQLPSNLISPSTAEAVLIWRQPITNYDNIQSYEIHAGPFGNSKIIANVTPVKQPGGQVAINRWINSPYNTDISTNVFGTTIGTTHWMVYRIKQDIYRPNNDFYSFPWAAGQYTLSVHTQYTIPDYLATRNGINMSNNVNVSLNKIPLSKITLYYVVGDNPANILDGYMLVNSSDQTLNANTFNYGANAHYPLSISNTAALKMIQPGGFGTRRSLIVNIFALNPAVPITSYYFTNELNIPYIKNDMLNNMLGYSRASSNPATPYINSPDLYWRKFYPIAAAPVLLDSQGMPLENQPQAPSISIVNANNFPGSVLYMTQNIPDNEPTLPSSAIILDNYAYITSNRIGVGSMPRVNLSCLRYLYSEATSPALVNCAPGVYLTEDGTKVGLLSEYNYDLINGASIILPISFTTIQPNIFPLIPVTSLTLPNAPIIHAGDFAPNKYYRNNDLLQLHSDANLPGTGINKLNSFRFDRCVVNYYGGCYAFTDASSQRLSLISSRFSQYDVLPILEVVDFGFNISNHKSFVNTFPNNYPFSYGGITYINVRNNLNSLPVMAAFTEDIRLNESCILTTGMFRNNTIIKTVRFNTYNGINTSSIASFLFAGCTSLISFNKAIFNNIAENAFDGCTAFVGTITTPSPALIITSDSDITIRANAFRNCTSITSVQLNAPSGYVNIDSSAFSGCTGISSFTINAVGINFTNTGTVNTLITPFISSLSSLNITLRDSSDGIIFTVINFPLLTSLALNISKLKLYSTGAVALFDGLSALRTVNVSNITQIGSNSPSATLVNNCPNLNSITVKSTYACDYIFSVNNNNALIVVDIKSPNISVNSNTFAGCSLTTLRLTNVVRFGASPGTIDINSELSGSYSNLKDLALTLLDNNQFSFTNGLSNFTNLEKFEGYGSAIVSNDFFGGASNNILISTINISHNFINAFIYSLTRLTSLENVTLKNLSLNQITVLATLPIYNVSLNPVILNGLTVEQYLSNNIVTLHNFATPTIKNLELTFDSSVTSIEPQITRIMNFFMGDKLILRFNNPNLLNVYDLYLTHVIRLLDLTIEGNIKIIKPDTLTLARLNSNFSQVQSSYTRRLAAGTKLTIIGKIHITEGALVGVSTISNIYIEGDISIDSNISGSSQGGSTALNSLDIVGHSDISDSAFVGAQYLTNLRLQGDSTIGAYAFKGTNIKNLNISGYTNIGAYAFSGLTSLEKIIINKTLPGIDGIDLIVSIGEGAFFGCINLKAAPTLHEGLLFIDDHAFANTGVSGAITIPSSTIYGDNLFVGCTGITSITYNCDVFNFQDPTQVHSDYLDELKMDESLLTAYNVEGTITITPEVINRCADIYYKLPSETTIRTLDKALTYTPLDAAKFNLRKSLCTQLHEKMTNLYNSYQKAIEYGSSKPDPGQNKTMFPTSKLTAGLAIIATAVSNSAKMFMSKDDSDFIDISDISDNMSAIKQYTTVKHPPISPDTYSTASIASIHERIESVYYNYLNNNKAFPGTGSTIFELSIAIYLALHYPGVDTKTENKITNQINTYRSVVSDTLYWGIIYAVGVCDDLIRQIDQVNNTILFNINAPGITSSQFVNMPKSYTMPHSALTLLIPTDRLNLTELGIRTGGSYDEDGVMTREDTAYLDTQNNSSNIIYRGEQIQLNVTDASDENITTILINGTMKRNLEDIMTKDRGTAMVSIHDQSVFGITPYGINYTFNGDTTHIESMSGLVGSTININSAATLISEDALTDCTGCTINVNSQAVRMEEGCFNRHEESTLNITTEVGLFGSNMFEGGSDLTISSNIPLLNIPDNPEVPASNTRTVTADDIQFAPINGLTLPQLINYLSVKFNLEPKDITKLKFINIMNNSDDASGSVSNLIFAISFVEAGTMKERIVVSQAYDWFWCFPINQDVIMGGGHTVGHYNHPEYGIKEPAMVVGLHTWRIIPSVFNGREVGLNNNFAPNYFYINGIKYERTITRTDISPRMNPDFGRIEPAGDVILYRFASQSKDAKLALTGTMMMWLFDVISTLLTPLGFGISLKSIAIGFKATMALVKSVLKQAFISIKQGVTASMTKVLKYMTARIGKETLTLTRGLVGATRTGSSSLVTYSTRIASVQLQTFDSMLTSNAIDLATIATNPLYKSPRATVTKLKIVLQSGARESDNATKGLQGCSKRVLEEARSSASQRAFKPTKAGALQKISSAEKASMTKLLKGTTSEMDEVALTITTGELKAETATVAKSIASSKAVLTRSTQTTKSMVSSEIKSVSFSTGKKTATKTRIDSVIKKAVIKKKPTRITDSSKAAINASKEVLEQRSILLKNFKAWVKNIDDTPIKLPESLAGPKADKALAETYDILAKTKIDETVVNMQDILSETLTFADSMFTKEGRDAFIQKAVYEAAEQATNNAGIKAGNLAAADTLADLTSSPLRLTNAMNNAVKNNILNAKDALQKLSRFSLDSKALTTQLNSLGEITITGVEKRLAAAIKSSIKNTAAMAARKGIAEKLPKKIGLAIAKNILKGGATAATPVAIGITHLVQAIKNSNKNIKKVTGDTYDVILKNRTIDAEGTLEEIADKIRIYKSFIGFLDEIEETTDANTDKTSTDGLSSFTISPAVDLPYPFFSTIKAETSDSISKIRGNSGDKSVAMLIPATPQDATFLSATLPVINNVRDGQRDLVLSKNSTIVDYTYGLSFLNGGVSVYHNNPVPTAISQQYTNGDKFTIQTTRQKVCYFKNGSKIHENTLLPATGQLYGALIIYNRTIYITNIRYGIIGTSKNDITDSSDNIIDNTTGTVANMTYITTEVDDLRDFGNTVNIPTYVSSGSITNNYNESYSAIELARYATCTTGYVPPLIERDLGGTLPAAEVTPSPLFLRKSHQWAEIWMNGGGTMQHPILDRTNDFGEGRGYKANGSIVFVPGQSDSILPTVMFDESNYIFLAKRPVPYRIVPETTTTTTRDINSSPPAFNSVYAGTTGVTIDLRNRTSVAANEFSNGPSGNEPFSINTVIIPQSVSEIGENAFYNAGLTKVEFTQDDTATRDVTAPLNISNGAFAGNPLLESIIFPSNIGSIGAGALDDCESLTTVTFAGAPPADIDQSVLDVLNTVDTVNILPEYINDYSAILEEANINPVMPDGANTIYIYNLSFVKSMINNTARPENIAVEWLPYGIASGYTIFNAGSLKKTVFEIDNTPLYEFTRVQAVDGVSLADIDEETADNAQFKTGWICTYSANGIIPKF